MQKVADVLTIASQFVDADPDTATSAALCLVDAHRLYDAGNFDAARRRALRSLAYSVGILSPVYAAATSAVPLS